MKRLALVLASFATLNLTPALAQAPVTEPSAAALELARLLEPRWLVLIGRPTEAQAVAGLERKLLGSHYAPRGRSCDPTHPECAAAARAVAGKYGPVVARFYGRVVEEGWARVFDARLTPADMADTIRFLRSGSGIRFAQALRPLMLVAGGTEEDAALLQRAYTESLSGERPPEAGMFDEFYDRTARLPRGPELRVPPPPSLPPPPPRR